MRLVIIIIIGIVVIVSIVTITIIIRLFKSRASSSSSSPSPSQPSVSEPLSPSPSAQRNLQYHCYCHSSCHHQPFQQPASLRQQAGKQEGKQLSRRRQTFTSRRKQPHAGPRGPTQAYVGPRDSGRSSSKGCFPPNVFLTPLHLCSCSQPQVTLPYRLVGCPMIDLGLFTMVRTPVPKPQIHHALRIISWQNLKIRFPTIHMCYFRTSSYAIIHHPPSGLHLPLSASHLLLPL